MRRTSLTRKNVKPKVVREDWHDANRKRTHCRICGDPNVELAHTIGRAWQNVKVSSLRRWIPPDAVVPLCKSRPEKTGCHTLYDARRISLIGYLTLAEYRNAITTCWRLKLDCRRRLGGGRYKGAA